MSGAEETVKKVFKKTINPIATAIHSPVKSELEDVGRVAKQTAHEAGLKVGTEPKEKAKRKAKEQAVSAKAAARARIKPMPDPELAKAAQRKAAGRRRATRGGRAATILSASEDRLG